MAATILSYSAVITKMRGMYGRLLTAENYELLMSMSRVGDIVRWLKENGGYAETLKDISEASVHRSSLENAFHAALIVDAKKLSAMLGAKKYLSGTDLKAAENFWGSEIDAQNILWTYRYKKYYHFSKEETLRHLVPNKYKIRKEQLLRLADSSVADFERVVAETRYSRLFANSRDVEWDRRVTDYLCRMYMRQIRRSAYNFTTIAAYLYLKEIDIRNIITIVEGVRYRIGPSEIRRYLITGVDYGN